MLADFPFAAVFTFFFFLGMARGQGTYWLARVVTEQTLKHTRPTAGWRLAVHRWLSSSAADRGRSLLNKWGLPAIPMCYLTVGVQTMVLAAAGVTRVSWLRFSVVQVPGALAWAGIYSTIGFAAWTATWKAAAAQHPGVVALSVFACVVAVTTLVVRRRRGRAVKETASV